MAGDSHFMRPLIPRQVRTTGGFHFQISVPFPCHTKSANYAVKKYLSPATFHTKKPWQSSQEAIITWEIAIGAISDCIISPANSNLQAPQTSISKLTFSPPTTRFMAHAVSCRGGGFWEKRKRPSFRTYTDPSEMSPIELGHNFLSLPTS